MDRTGFNGFLDDNFNSYECNLDLSDKFNSVNPSDTYSDNDEFADFDKGKFTSDTHSEDDLFSDFDKDKRKQKKLEKIIVVPSSSHHDQPREVLCDIIVKDPLDECRNFPTEQKEKVSFIKLDRAAEDRKYRGTLYLRIGPMFSGKTTWLNGELTQLADKRFSVLKIIHSDDKRHDVASCDHTGSTHNSSYKTLSPKITCIRASELVDINVSKFHVVGVDEAQFFPDLVDVIKDWVENHGKHVRVSGLCGDANKQKFGQTLDLIPFCDEVLKLNASCKICLEELEHSGFNGNILSIVGPFSKRLGASLSQKDVGGADKYIPVCRYHHSV